jgi:hypothetical protein
MENVSYLGYPNNIRLANERAELVLSTDFGPRILRYALAGGENVLGEIPPTEQATRTPFGDDWHLYGGHRLWYAPEHPVRSYWPDNQPIVADAHGTTVTLTQPIEPHTRLQKRIEVTLHPDSTRVTVVHRITNHSAFDVELAVWALTVMAKGGRGIYPNAPYVPHPEGLLPARPLVLWPYTRLHDERWTFGDHFFQLRHDPSRTDAQKVGFYNAEGWIAYAWRGLVFVKVYDPLPGPHADLGCNTETFTNHLILELETLGPLVKIPPGGAAEHTERWSLFEADPGEEHATMADVLDPLVEEARRVF